MRELIMNSRIKHQNGTANLEHSSGLKSTAISGLEPLLTEQRLSEILKVSVPTLSRWRKTGRAPRFIVLGPRRIGYRPSDVRAWMEERARAIGDVFTAIEPVANRNAYAGNNAEPEGAAA
jgi:predicted DNA-binding transcriptional regulator AlpA